MNYIEVYVDGYLIDIEEDKIKFPITYELIDIKNLNKRSGSRTKTVTVPRTEKNDKIFGHAFDINAQNQFSKYDYREIRVDENTLPIFRGLLQLTEVTKNTISFFCFAELSKFKGISGTKTLNDLYLGDLEHLYDLTIFDTWNGTYPTDVPADYAYCPIDYGQFNIKTLGYLAEPPTIDFRVTDMFPQVYLSRIIRQICIDNGYSLVSNFFNHPIHSKMMIPFTNEEFVHSFGRATRDDGFWGYQFGLAYLVSTEETIPIDVIVTDNLTQWDTAADEYTAASNQIVNVDLEGSITLNALPTGTAQATVFLEKFFDDSSTWAAVDGATLPFDGTDGLTVRLEFHTKVELLQNDKLRLRILIPVEIADVFIDIDSFKITPTNGRLIEYGDFVELSPNLPAIKQSDIFKWCAQMFGWVIEVDDDSGVITIDTDDEFFISNDVKDFSNKLNLRVDPVINYQSIDFYRKYNFLYTHDQNDYWLGVYDGINLSDSDVLFGDGKLYLTEQGEANTIGKVGFSPTVIQKSFTGGNDASTTWLELPTIQDKSDRITKKTNTTPRILINAGIIKVEKLSDGVSTEVNLGEEEITDTVDSIPLAYFQKRVYSDTIDTFTLNLSFQTPGGNTFWVEGNLIDEFYRATIESLSVSAMVTAYFNLDARDINELDFAVLWRVDEFNAHFRLNRILDYQPGGFSSTKVELIKKSVLNRNFNPDDFAELT